MVVVLEGGYNTDYLGQHASGVVKALKDADYGEPLQADTDAGFASVDDIDGKEAMEYAKDDVKVTSGYHGEFWKLDDG